jgi:hypothetical protein
MFHSYMANIYLATQTINNKDFFEGIRIKGILFHRVELFKSLFSEVEKTDEVKLKQSRQMINGSFTGKQANLSQLSFAGK